VGYQNSAEKLRKVRISEVLKELWSLREIEKPEEKILAYRKAISSIKMLAKQTEDLRLLDLAQQFSVAEQRSEAYLSTEIILEKISALKTDLEKLGDVVSGDTISGFRSCVGRFEEALDQARQQETPSFQQLYSLQADLTHELIGRRLEREIAPDLAQQMGFNSCPNIIRHSNQDIEVDYIGEKNNTTSPSGMGRLIKKRVLIIETKTTICKEDVEKFSYKVDLIREKYKRAALDFGYEIEVEAWIFACYNWTEEIKLFAKQQKILPFDNEELRQLLKKYGILDRRIPICP
jgi:hypothetical protein